MTDDERAIRDVIGNWFDATKAGDLPAVLNLMAEDVLFMVPGREPFGKEAFAAASRGSQGFSFDGSSEVREIEVFGNRAWVRTRIEMTMTPPGGEPVRRSGYTLSIFRKTPNGRWVIARDANLLTKDE